MSIYALSDLHLYKSIKDKPMDIFGAEWDNHMEKLEDGCKILKNDDLLLVPGDISWAMYLADAYEDLEFINDLPGKKVISKGNHDYWWESHKKLKEYLDTNNFDTISFLHNNFYEYGNIAICGNKGYFYNFNAFKENADASEKLMHDKLLYEREISRLELSLKMADESGIKRKLVQTHYPPSKSGCEPDEKVLELFEKYGVEICVYGHLHSVAQKKKFEGQFGNTYFHFVSCEYLNFTPKLIIE